MVGEFETDYWYIGIFLMLIYNVLVILTIETCRRYRGFQIIFCCIILPIAPTYLYYGTLTIIEWIKFLSIIAMISISIIIRYWKQNRFLYWILCVLFLLNIIEPFLLEILLIVEKNTGYLYLNILSGVVLIICTNLPLPSTQTIFISNKPIHKTLNYKTDIFYIITFTMWNYTFSLNYKCYEKLLSDTIYLFVPIYFLIFDKIKICKEKCFKLNVLSSEWFFLRLYALLFWFYIDSLPIDITQKIPFWNIIECDDKSVNILVIWMLNIISLLSTFGLIIYQIYPLINPTESVVINSNHNTGHPELVDHENTEIDVTDSTISTQNQQNQQQHQQQQHQHQQQQINNIQKEEENKNTVSLVQLFLKKCAIIEYDNNYYY